MTYAIIAASILLAGGVVLWYRRRTQRTLERLNRMLDIAMQGEFTENSFDETMLSALESKLAHYLAASTVSARNVAAEKDKLKTLIGDISHQTKTPIANILLYTQLLSEQPLRPESRPCVDALEGQTKKLQNLLDALVKTSRLESGVIVLHPACGTLQAVIDAAFAQIAPKAEEKKIRITLEPTEADAVFDPKWTEEAVYNLLDNAVEACAGIAGACVSLRCAQLSGCLVICTENPVSHGPAEKQRRISELERGVGSRVLKDLAEKYNGSLKQEQKDGVFMAELILNLNQS